MYNQVIITFLAILCVLVLSCRFQKNEDAEFKIECIHAITNLAIQSELNQEKFLTLIAATDNFTTKIYGDSLMVIECKESVMDNFYGLEVRIKSGQLSSIDLFKP